MKSHHWLSVVFLLIFVGILLGVVIPQFLLPPPSYEWNVVIITEPQELSSSGICTAQAEELKTDAPEKAKFHVLFTKASGFKKGDQAKVKMETLGENKLQGVYLLQKKE